MIHVTRNSTLPKEMNLSQIRKIAEKTFSYTGIKGDASIVFTDNRTIQNLNKDYRKIDSATDVLSFSSAEIDPMTNIRYLGDIVISAEKAQEQSQQSGRPMFDELTMLIVHGCLHLSGLDHSSKNEKETMKSSQEAILSSLGVSDPSWPED